jgi:hypothetical protein
MGVGLQVWNASGTLVFDTGDRMSRVLGSFVATAAGSGSITLPTGVGSYWYIVFPSSGSSYYAPVITISGNTLSWSPSTLFTPAVDCTILYGVY